MVNNSKLNRNIDNEEATEKIQIADDTELRGRLEKIILSSLLINHNLIDVAQSQLNSDDFYFTNNRKIYQAICDLANNGVEVNLESLTNKLESSNIFNNNFTHNDFNTLYRVLTEQSDQPYKFQFALEYVKQIAIHDRTVQLGEEIAKSKFSFTKSHTNNVKRLNRFSEIEKKKKNERMNGIEYYVDMMQSTLARVINRDHSKLTGTDTGFKGINKLTDGFHKGDLIILAARPGTGKTALAINFAYNAAKAAQNENEENKDNSSYKPKRVVIFSIEMSGEQLIQRMTSLHTKVDISKLRNGNLTSVEMQIHDEGANYIRSLPISIDDSPGLNINDIQSKLKQLSAIYDITLVVVDYLQLLRGPEKTKRTAGMNRQEEVATISRTLKITAREINTPILALAQLSREIEKRRSSSDGEQAEPLLSDLRESGAIEQDADLVTFLYARTQKPLEIEDDEKQKTKSDVPINAVPITLTIKKHRNGATGDVDLLFFKNLSLFDDE